MVFVYRALSIWESLMAKGVKLDLNIGANFSDEWQEIQTKKEPTNTQNSNYNPNEILLPAKHFLHFKKEKRRGKVVTLVGLFHLSKDETSALLKKIKKSLGTGGVFKDGYMEFQGELQNKLREKLVQNGFRFKK